MADHLPHRSLPVPPPVLETSFRGEKIVCDPSGALFLPSRGVLIVSDMHLERGAAFARRGMMLPPYDTLATLRLLDSVVRRDDPRTVVSLGDAFHDRAGAAAMPMVFRSMLAETAAGRGWTWVSGNHDPNPPEGLGGAACDRLEIGPFALVHEPRPGRSPGEIAGHLHPRAGVSDGRRVSGGPCFALDGERMVMPAFGSRRGGLDVGHRAFAGIFDVEAATAFVVGATRIFPIPFARLLGGGRSVA